jgi:hypothetical protein
MSDRDDPTGPDPSDAVDTDTDTETATGDPDLGSTWNTLRDTADVDELLSEDELEDLMVEPTAGELGVLTDTDVPGRPG